MLGAACGYQVQIVMSERASGERRQIIEHFGAKLILFSQSGYQHGIAITREMAERDPRVFLPNQFENPLNADDHEHEMAQEILQQVPGAVDVFVSGYGTGGTLAGCSKAIKSANPNACVVAMEPAESALLAGEEACCHWIEGIAGGFVPPLLRGVSIDQTCKVSSVDAINMTRRLNREFGLLVGSSSGANVSAALQMRSNAIHRPSLSLCCVIVPSGTSAHDCLRSHPPMQPSARPARHPTPGTIVLPMSELPIHTEHPSAEEVQLSIIVPIFNEAESIPTLYRELKATLDPLGKPYELLMVDDGSTDGSNKLLTDLAAQDARLRLLVLRRNYGQTAAMSAGIDHARGEILIPIDADLQNDPADIPKLINKLDEGYDVVSGWRADRQDKGLTRVLPA